MRAVIWRSTLYRLPKYQRLRIQNRNFVTSTIRYASTPIPPNDPSTPHNASVNEDSIRQSPDQNEKANVRASQGAFVRRGARSGRSRDGIPPPPPLPDWFLKNNIRVQPNRQSSPPSGKPMRLQVLGPTPSGPHEWGHVISLPYFEPPIFATKEVTEGRAAFQDHKTKHYAGTSSQKMPPVILPGNSDQDTPPAESSVEEQKAEKSQSPSQTTTSTTVPESSNQATPPEELSVEEQKAQEVRLLRLDKMGITDAQWGQINMEFDPLPPMQEIALDPQGWARMQAQVLVHSILDLTSRQATSSNSQLPRNLVFASPDATSHDEMDRFIEDVADLVNADIIRLDANDIAEMAGDYIDNGHHGPGTISSLAYDAFEGMAHTNFQDILRTQSKVGGDGQVSGDKSATVSGDDHEPDLAALPGIGGLDGLRSLIKANEQMLSKALGGASILGVSVQPMSASTSPQDADRQTSAAKSEKPDHDELMLDRWQELKLEAFLESILNSKTIREASDLSAVTDSFLRQKFPERQEKIFETSPWNPDTASTASTLVAKTAHDSLRYNVAHHLWATFPDLGAFMTYAVADSADLATLTEESPRGTILHIKDIDRIHETPQGEVVIKRLTKSVSRRRKEGERLVVIGTSSSTDGTVMNLPSFLEEDAEFHTIPYPSVPDHFKVGKYKLPEGQKTWPIKQSSRRLVELNLRNIHNAIKQFGIPHCENMFHNEVRNLVYLPGTHPLGEVALEQEDVQRVVLFANGLRALYTSPMQETDVFAGLSNDRVDLSHIAVALTLIDKIDHSVNAVEKIDPQAVFNSEQVKKTSSEATTAGKKSQKPRADLDKIFASASKHEQRLLMGVVDPTKIKTTFSDVHAKAETIEALKTITSLSLQRPEAFSYGVLANDRLPGLLLYGPPGTGKTLLAKAVAKESGATVLEVSGAQIYEKYVGEGEKMVRAIFSLARKLSPCVVFIDEADSIFASRGGAGARSSHTHVINQFLRDWDGMDDRGVFIMVATNRPFDLDDAVLRRLPRRLLVDLPVAKDRESILKIHLKGEELDPAVELDKLAERTPFYSGSDLKNLCVAAALTAVREENELLDSKKKEDPEFKLPERRILNHNHFDKAVQEISASISEDMGSLNAIKKFDEKYGDRRGRRKKSGYGFGVGNSDAVDESAARVRGDMDQAPKK